MKREISPAVVIGVLVCVLGVAGFLLHRTYFAPRAYAGALKLPQKPPQYVRTPYGYMTAEHAAKAGFAGTVPDTPQTANAAGR